MTVRLLIFAAVIVATPALAGPAKSPDGLWRCSAAGPLPIGLLTIKGGTYRFQAVSNTAWAPKPSDASNGSGVLSVVGSKITVTSGPLVVRSKVKTGFYGTTSSPYSGTYEYIDLNNDPTAAYLMRCYRPD